MMNLADAPQPLPKVAPSQMSLADRWILDRLNDAIREVTTAIDRYEFNVAAMKVYDFIWHEFCDWYIELSKDALKGGGERQAAARYVIIHGFDQMLRLLHPFMPFVSEEIWQVIRPYVDDADLAPNLPIAKFPIARDSTLLSPQDSDAMDVTIKITNALNNLRALLGLHPGERIDESEFATPSEDLKQRFETFRPYIENMAKLRELRLLDHSGGVQGGWLKVFVPGVASIQVRKPADFNEVAVKEKLDKRTTEVRKFLDQQEKRLNNPDFVARATDEAQQETREKRDKLREELAQLELQTSMLA
jgi:valyl-tRNA synthetase